MRTTFSRIQLTMYHLVMVAGHKNMLPAHIINKGQTAADDYYNASIPADKLTAIKAKHGFTDMEWIKTLQSSASFYFSPTPEMDACNKEIQEFIPEINCTHIYYYIIIAVYYAL